MSDQALLPCFMCGESLKNALSISTNQPSEGTEFSSYGHYGSTFWDSFEGEQVILNVCDECLRKNTERLARHKRYRNVVVDEPGLRLSNGGRGIPVQTTVGREWLEREPVPYFDGPEDMDSVTIEPEEIGTLTGYRIEWIRDWAEAKKRVLAAHAEKDAELE